MNAIFTALEPNTRLSDSLYALTTLIQPWAWKYGLYPKRIEDWFINRFHVDHAVTFDSARSALFTLLQACQISKGDEVILQTFTCVAVVNPILWSRATPVYVDIDADTLTISVDTLRSAITKKTKAIIVQHTFGYPADLDAIMAIAKENEIIVIEDCAHTIGGKYKDQLLGTIGDASIFSFGRDKSISGVAGGIALTANAVIAERIRSLRMSTPPGFVWIFKQLLHPPLTFIIKMTYRILSIGKIIHYFSLKLGLIAKASTRGEKECSQMPPFMPGLLANGLAKLTYRQLSQLDEQNFHRKYVEKLYRERLQNIFKMPKYEGLDYFLLRYVLFIEKDKRDSIVSCMGKVGVYLDTWYDTPVAPQDVNIEAAGYQIGSCPVGEEISSKVLNLPVNITIGKGEVERICSSLLECMSHD